MWCCGRKSGDNVVAKKNEAEIHRLQTVGLRRDAPPPQVIQDVEAPVVLNVYSLVENNEKLAKLGMGIYHTGVIVYGIEWSYGEVTDNPNASGLFCVHPGHAAGNLFRTIRVGVTTRSPMQVDTILHRLENEWRSSEYHLLHHNCNHFAQTLCNLLSTVQKLRVPAWCNRAARVSDRVVPRGLATKVLRMMDDEPPKAKPAVPKTNVNELPVSIIPPRWYKHPKVAQPPRYCYIVPTHQWTNSQMSTPRSSQVSSPTPTELRHDSFVPPPGGVMEPLSSIEERQPAAHNTTSSSASKKRQRPRAAAAGASESAPPPFLSSTEESHWPPLAPSRVQSTATPVGQSPAMFSPASRGSSQVNSFAGDVHEVVFASSSSGAVTAARRRESIRAARQGRPPRAPGSHHSGGEGSSPAHPDTELSSTVYDRLSVPNCARRSSGVLMVIPEIDFTPCPGQATPVGAVLRRSHAEPGGLVSDNHSDASSVASSVVGEDVALVVESELDAALAEEARLTSFGGPGVRHDTDLDAVRLSHIQPTEVYDDSEQAALRTPSPVSPLTTVEIMKRRLKQEGARVFASHRHEHTHRHQGTDGVPAATTSTFTDLEAGAVTTTADTAAAQRRYAYNGLDGKHSDDQVPQPHVSSEAVSSSSPPPPALTAYEMRPPSRVAASTASASPPPPPTLQPLDGHVLSNVPQPPGAAVMVDHADSPNSVISDGRLTDKETPPSSPPPEHVALASPIPHDTSESSHIVNTNGRGTSEVMWQGEALPIQPVRRWSVASDRDSAVTHVRTRATSVTDARVHGTPRRPQLAERSQTPQGRRTSLPGTPQHGDDVTTITIPSAFGFSQTTSPLFANMQTSHTASAPATAQASCEAGDERTAHPKAEQEEGPHHPAPAGAVQSDEL